VVKSVVVVMSSTASEEVAVNSINSIKAGSCDAKGYADAIEKLLRDEELRRKLSDDGAKFVRQFDRARVAAT